MTADERHTRRREGMRGRRKENAYRPADRENARQHRARLVRVMFGPSAPVDRVPSLDPPPEARHTASLPSGESMPRGIPRAIRERLEEAERQARKDGRCSTAACPWPAYDFGLCAGHLRDLIAPLVSRGFGRRLLEQGI